MVEYRILQIADNTFNIEKLHHFTKRRWPWSAPIACSEWRSAFGVPGYPYPFSTLENALKWIADKRKFPIVVAYIPPEK